MALGYLAALRNNQLNEVTTLIDAGAGGGFIRGYSGTRPATGGTATTLLFELTHNTTSFPTPSAGAMTANAITNETAAPAAGTVTWFRVVDSNGVFVMDGDVAVSGSDMNISNTTIAVNDVISIGTNFTLTAGNP